MGHKTAWRPQALLSLILDDPWGKKKEKNRNPSWRIKPLRKKVDWNFSLYLWTEGKNGRKCYLVHSYKNPACRGYEFRVSNMYIKFHCTMALLSRANSMLPPPSFPPFSCKKMHSCACVAVRTQVSAIFVCHVVTRPRELKCASCTGRRTARAASSHGLGRIQETTDSWQNSSMTGNWSCTRERGGRR